MALPVNIQPGQVGHAALHNETNAKVNQIEDDLVELVGATPAVVYQTVLTTDDARLPADLVVWLGGTVKPTNMALNDLWYSEVEVIVTPPDEEEPPPVGANQHSVFDGTNTPTFSAYDDGGTLRVATGFYTYGDSPVLRVVGMRIFKTGLFGADGNAFLNMSTPTTAPNLLAPLQTKAYTGLVDGWNSIYFDTPVALPIGTGVWVGYQSSDGSYVHSPSPQGPFLPAPDGSKIVLMDTAPVLEGVTVARSYFSENGGATGIGSGAPVYGIDIIVDEGP